MYSQYKIAKKQYRFLLLHCIIIHHIPLISFSGDRDKHQDQWNHKHCQHYLSEVANTMQPRSVSHSP